VNAPDEYAYSWEDYKRRVRWWFAAWIGGFALLVVCATALNWISLAPLALGVLGPAWGILCVILGFRVQNFRCPRCHRQFFKSIWYYHPFSRKCVHCGLAKWGVTDSHGEPIR